MYTICYNFNIEFNKMNFIIIINFLFIVFTFYYQESVNT